ncbi:hypothetical protein CLUG_02293 [Clavispora lusitaniae ATCC 42720]|uniref:Uncharacterized protein n=1 Tax=Clavispora lusitaniae (strain ATCC 42720) TaxID=306902 RepID=C4Y261_CLAL4|nr:uncharacterized protein CLUG_02293 [Clavispora lusitaniae ATCC 42720]EEQ38171.1 hypothetical protein CLUG_02293 [Clavispora lusitaniae ATCC 42720]
MRILLKNELMRHNGAALEVASPREIVLVNLDNRAVCWERKRFTGELWVGVVDGDRRVARCHERRNHIDLDGHRQDRKVAIVYVFTNQVHSSWSSGYEQRLFAIKVGELGFDRFVASKLHLLVRSRRRHYRQWVPKTLFSRILKISEAVGGQLVEIIP